MRIEPGYYVSPHVRLVRRLRKGGMGSIWCADHLALKTQVAVKFMSAALAQDDAMVTRFTREAAFAARIKSPHVVHVYDHGLTEDGIPYIVMELLDGEDLAERVKRGGPLSLHDVAKIVNQLCKALGKAHQAGIIHRDIKLNNVFLMETDGDIFTKLLDFGIARQKDQEGTDITTTGDMVGTLVYMSPEQFHNAKQVDEKTDFWSLAVVAYRTLTGLLPFKDDDGIGALLTAINGSLFSLPSEVREGIPTAVDAWFQRAFRRNPEERFTSAKEMAEEFDLAAGRETTQVPSTRSDSLSLPQIRAFPELPQTATRKWSPDAETLASESTPATGGTPAQAFSGSSPVESAAPKSKSRLIVLVSVLLVGIGLAVFFIGERSKELPSQPSLAATQDTATNPPPTSSVTEPGNVAASTTASATSTAAESSSALPSSSAVTPDDAGVSPEVASATAAPSASAKPPDGTTKIHNKTPLPPKDYGF